MRKIDGRKIAQLIIADLKRKIVPKKILAIISVGENPASESFIKQKEKVAKELGVDFRIYKFDENIFQDNLRKEVGKISNLKKVGGVIVQLPLPKHINNQYILNTIPREKDLDVLGERALGAFYVGRNPILPPAVAVTQEILLTVNYKLQTARVAVVGLGQLIGKPISLWLMKKCEEIYLLDQNSDLELLKRADLIICGAGQAKIIKPEMLKEGAGVIDFGYERSEDQSGEISGNFDVFASSDGGDLSAISFYTPTPGGTGPILVARIFANFYTLNNA